MKPVKSLRAWINAHPRLMVAASLLAFMGVSTAAFRSAIPFGTAASWSAATNGDPNATQGVWSNSNNNAFWHGTNNLDYQIDTVVYSIEAFGCKPNDGVDDTTCFQNAINAVSATSGGTVYVPMGTFLVTTSLSIPGDYIRIIGAGVTQTTVQFNPAAGPAVLFSFNKGTAIGSVGNQIMNLRIVGTNGNTFQKIGIDVVDQSTMVIHDIWIDPSNSTWTGNTSIGIRLRGREALYIDEIRAIADRPFEFDQCPNPPTTQSNDHVHIWDTYLHTTPGIGGSIIFIADGAVVTNLRIDGDNAWLIDKYGIFWSDTTSPAAHYNVDLSGIRMEQAIDATGWAMYIDSTTGIQNVDIHDNYFSQQNGIHANGVTELRIANGVFPTLDATKKHLEVTNTKDLHLENDLWQITTTATITGMTLIYGAPQVATGAALPPEAWYSDSTTATNVPVQFGGTSKFNGAVQLGSTLDTATSAGLVIGNGNMTTLTIKNNGTNTWQWASGGSLFPITNNAVSIGQDSGSGGAVLLPSLIDAGSLRSAATAAATSGSTLKSGGNLTSRGFYWNGSASTIDDLAINHVMDSTTPTSHAAVSINGGVALQINSTGSMTLTAIAQASLGTPANGTIAYCNDCTIANPCAGGGTGALAKRLNGAWVCN